MSGNDYCYVLVTHNKQPAEGWVWNSEKTVKMSSVLILSKIFFLSLAKYFSFLIKYFLSCRGLLHS